jgi:hypothetical protein
VLDDDRAQFRGNTTAGTFGVLSGAIIHVFAYDHLADVIEKVNMMRDNPRYFGKEVFVSDDEASEDNYSINLAPCPPDIPREDYTASLYRNKHGVVKSYAHYYASENGEDKSIIHFGEVPWKLKQEQQGNFFSLIFRNALTGEVRRYIVNGFPVSFFMLEGEILAILDGRSYKGYSIIRCSTGKEIKKMYHSMYFQDCGNYAASVVDVFDEKRVTILRAQPI